MASNNYTSANVVPSADTFREWVDLTNRITYDMEKVVVTVAANTQGARTSGNGSVNGYFSANTLIVESHLRGADANSTIYGTAAPLANLVIISNSVFKANSSHAAIIHAQANAHFTGEQVEASSNVFINSTASVFQSNATLNDFNSPVDIDNALTTINSTNTLIAAGELNVTSNAAFEANVSMDAHTVELSSNNVKITANTDVFQSNATLNDFNSNVAINAANVYIEATNTHIGGSAGAELNVDANTVFTANVNITDAAADLNIGADVVVINSSATTFQSDAGTNILNTPVDINADVDVDNAITDFNSSTKVAINGPLLDINSATVDIDSATLVDINVPDFNVSGANVTISSDQVDIAAADAVFVKGANTTIGDANSDVLSVNANTVLNDKLKVVKAVDLDSTLNVDGATTLNGAVTLGDATADDLTFIGRAASGITPKANGTLSLGTAGLRFDGQFDDLVADDLTVDDDAGIGGDLTVSGAGTVDGVLTVNSALSVTYPGSTRTIIAGAGTTASDRFVIKSQVGNTEFGLMPLQGNNVPLGNNTNRWVVSGKTGNFSNTLAAGTTTITGDIIVSGEVDGATLDISSTADIAGNVDMHAGLDLEGAFNHTSGAHAVTGAATFASTLGVTGAATLADTLGVTGATTLGNKLTVNNTTEANATHGSIKTTGGILAAKDIRTTANGNFGYVNVTTDLDVDNNANIDGNLVVDGTTTLGDAVGDTVTINGNVSRMVPSANGNALGINDKRWAGQLTTLSTTGDITASSDVDVTGEVNAGTLLVNGASAFKGNSTWHRSGTAANLTITANSTQHNMGIGGIVCSNLVVSGTATLPSDTALTLSTVSGDTVNVADVINLGTGSNANPKVIFGSDAGSGSKANVIFQDAEFSTTFTPRQDNTIDIGTSSKGFRTGYFDTSVVVGTTVANTEAVLADNIYARDDLVASYSSDQQLKDNVLVIDNALNKLEHIGGYSFTWNDLIQDPRVGSDDYGVIAQEIEHILPAAVKINSRGHKTVNYNAVIPLLIEAVKELSAKVDYYMNAEEGDEE